MYLCKVEQEGILADYGVYGATYEKDCRVSPDMVLYFFVGKNGERYVLMVADFLGGYEELEMPYEFEFEEEKSGDEIFFQVVKTFSYKEGAVRKAEGYVDDKHVWTKASTGDVCMLFGLGAPLVDKK